MAKTRKQKEESVQSLADNLTKMKSAVFTNFDGLKVKDTHAMRNLLRENQVAYVVAKKSLLKLALQKAGLQDVDLSKVPGGLGVAFGIEDEVLPAKLLATFAKTHPELKLVAAIFQRRLIDAAAVAQLAKLPGKQELYAKLVWLVNYPPSGLVNVMAGTLRSLVYALKAIQEKK